jgi:hypothetical protein
MKRALILVLTVAFAATAFAHNGLLNYIPTVPDPMTMIVDGLDDDWGWYDQDEFAIVDWSADSYGGDRVVSDADCQVVYLQAWSPPPDNAYYMFTRIMDDTLRIQEGDNLDAWWNDDTMNIGMDLDHGGGNWVPNADEGYTWPMAIETGYQFWISPVFSNSVGSQSVPIPTAPDFNLDFYQYQTNPPFSFMNTTVLPAGAENFTPNVEITMELVHRGFDVLDYNDMPNASIPHVWAEDQVVHINMGYEDGDWGPHGEDQIWHQPGTTFEHNNFDTGTDNLAVLTTDGVVQDSFVGRNAGDCGFAGCDPDGTIITSVEDATWARIKNQLTR